MSDIEKFERLLTVLEETLKLGSVGNEAQSKTTYEYNQNRVSFQNENTRRYDCELNCECCGRNVSDESFYNPLEGCEYCSYCGRNNHLSDDCFHRPRQYWRDPKCEFCGRSNHASKDCFYHPRHDCIFCGRNNHFSEDCFYRPRHVCDFCGRDDHFSEDCFYHPRQYPELFCEFCGNNGHTSDECVLKLKECGKNKNFDFDEEHNIGHYYDASGIASGISNSFEHHTEFPIHTYSLESEKVTDITRKKFGEFERLNPSKFNAVENVNFDQNKIIMTVLANKKRNVISKTPQEVTTYACRSTQHPSRKTKAKLKEIESFEVKEVESAISFESCMPKVEDIELIVDHMLYEESETFVSIVEMQNVEANTVESAICFESCVPELEHIELIVDHILYEECETFVSIVELQEDFQINCVVETLDHFCGNENPEFVDVFYFPEVLQIREIETKEVKKKNTEHKGLTSHNVESDNGKVIQYTVTPSDTSKSYSFHPRGQNKGQTNKKFARTKTSNLAAWRAQPFTSRNKLTIPTKIEESQLPFSIYKGAVVRAMKTNVSKQIPDLHHTFDFAFLCFCYIVWKPRPPLTKHPPALSLWI